VARPRLRRPAAPQHRRRPPLIAVERARLFERSARLGAVEERNRLAREIHDTLAQNLTATGLQIESAEALLETNADPERVRAALDRALSLTQSNLDEARRAVLDLRASPLENRSLPEALRALVERWEAETGVSARFRSVNGSRPLPPGVEAALYRVCGEALNNVARHAEARRVTVRLVATPESVGLLVEDDGRGFDPSEVPEGRHGIVGMRERVEVLGGALRVESGPEGGTRVEATVPLGESGVDKIRLLVADDHPMLREGLVAVLGTQPDFEVVGEAGDGEDAVRLAERLEPDVILLDLEMPNVDGVEALQRLQEANSSPGPSSLPPTTRTSASSAPCAPGPAATCSRAPPGLTSSPPSAPSTPGAPCSGRPSPTACSDASAKTPRARTP
jgi:CheY-like chemotaxis protein/two-component sensor histidine kinase